MRIRSQHSVRKIGDNYMMVAESDAGMDYTRVISLNETAHYLLQQVETKEFTKEEWVDMLVNRYEVSREQAEADVQTLIEKLEKSGVIEG